MPAVVVFSCDLTRHGQPCRGALPTRSLDYDDAAEQAERAGWTLAGRGDPVVCPSPGHDGEVPR